MDGRRSTMPNPYDPWEWYICLRLVSIYGKFRYTPEIEDKKLLYVKGIAFFKPAFWVAMFVFWGVITIHGS